MSEFVGSNFSMPEPEEQPPPTNPPTAATKVFYASMSENVPMTTSLLPSTLKPPLDSEPILAVPLAALCPPTLHVNAPHFSSIHEEYLAEQEGLRRMAEKVQEAE